jgi:nucleotide-binding universal stress UspA family protein
VYLAKKSTASDVSASAATRSLPEAILQEIRSSEADLVVLGVDRIAGDKLDFGSVAHAVISKSNASVLLIADGETASKN